MSRGLPQIRWLLAAFLVAPLALIGCCLPRKWLFPLGLTPEEPKHRGPALKIPPEKLLAGKALVGEVRQLRQKGQLQEAADLLEVLIDVAEETSRRSRSDIPFWYYEELGRIRRTQKDSKREKKVLARFLAQTTGSHPKVEKRFQRRIAQL